MQRAVASASSSRSPGSEASSSKKRKLDHSPSQGRINAHIDQALVKAALDEQEATRRAALEKHSSVDTHWTLDDAKYKMKAATAANPPLNIVYVGYGDLDSSNESGDNEEAPAKGRTCTKSYKASGDQKPGQRNKSFPDGSDEANPKRQRRLSGGDVDWQSRSAEGARAKEFRDKRNKKEVRLNKLTSISMGGSNSFSPRGSSKGRAR